ncbi:large subunit ribosomal protein L36e [Pancytospora philotis]|nr:large subunit ribosomal protein L36e [Pancytospora philotis]
MEMQSYLKKIRVPHKVTKINPPKAAFKKSYGLSESQKLAMNLANEICGLCPYEKKAVELIKADEYKSAKKFLKLRYGSWARVDRKFEYLLKNFR